MEWDDGDCAVTWKGQRIALHPKENALSRRAKSPRVRLGRWHRLMEGFWRPQYERPAVITLQRGLICCSHKNHW